MKIEIAACSIDGLGNTYDLVARESDATGPWWVTPVEACRHLPYSSSCAGMAVAPFERSDDRDTVHAAIRAALIEATSSTPSQGLRYALAMAFPSQRPALGDWRNDAPLVIPYTSDQDGARPTIVQRLVRHGRTRALGPICDDAREAAILAWSVRAHSARLALQAACYEHVFGASTVDDIRQARAERVAALSASLGEYAAFKPRGGEEEGLWLADVLTGAEPVEDLRQVLCGYYGWRNEERITAYVANHSTLRVQP